MKTLVKWQIISFISRGIAMALGLIQSFVILRILTVSEWGLVQIAMSIGGAFGIYQHLGLSSGLTREISASKEDTEIFKKFLTGATIRYCVTLPISALLFFGARYIAISQYSDPALIVPIMIYAVVLLFQSVQSLFDAVISGTKRFKQLFIYQASIALVSVALYIPLVYFYKINGYFYAFFLFNLIASVVLGIIAFKPLHGKLQLPSTKDFRFLLKDLLSISLAIYAVKVIYTWWEKLGPILLGLTVSKEMVGYLAFALLYGKKIMMVSDSVTAVNLPVLSRKYIEDINGFRRLFAENFDKVFAFIIFAASSAIFWSKEIIQLLVGGNKYDNSLPLILPAVFAFVFYALINIVKSSIVVPAKLIWQMILSFVILLGCTVGFYFGLTGFFGSLSSMAYAMVLGGLLSFSFMVISSQLRLEFRFFTHSHTLLFIQGVVIALLAFIGNIFVKGGLYVLCSGLFLWATFISGFITGSDLGYVREKVASLRGKFLP